MVPADITHPKYGLPCLNGCHSRRKGHASDPCYGQSRIFARYESQLDYLTTLSRIRAEILARADLGAVL